MYSFLHHILSGQYRDGYPDGWGWIRPPDDTSNSTGALRIQFRGGHLKPDGAVFMDRVTGLVWTGEYFDGEIYGTFYDAQLMMVSTSALINITVHCMLGGPQPVLRNATKLPCHSSVHSSVATNKCGYIDNSTDINIKQEVLNEISCSIYFATLHQYASDCVASEGEVDRRPSECCQLPPADVQQGRQGGQQDTVQAAPDTWQGEWLQSWHQ